MMQNDEMLTIWVIDDDNIFTFGFNKLMQNSALKGQMIVFNSATTAIEQFTDQTKQARLPDVMFVDINMPVMSGWEFIEKFGKISAQTGKNIPVYIISSSVALNDIERAKNNPLITDYILKPIDQDLLNAILSTLRGSANGLAV
ncbi:two-component system response regulator [Mucilaginibacter sp.]|uniref:response regulator n=1 Tax=Mucilaginibacter sp. TaxID=1882438 RepID=UPI0035BBF76C